MSEHGVSNEELARSLVRIELKLDKITGDHEDRLRRIERFTYVAMGLGTTGAVSGIVSALTGGGHG